MKPNISKIKNFTYPYLQYGSKSSTDIDVIIFIPKSDMPPSQEERKRLVKKLMLDNNLGWNSILAVEENGVLVDTIYTKSWIDSLNNAVLSTYKHHQQHFENPITQVLKRNKTLAIYKAVRVILTLLTRTELRTKIKPIIKGVHPFYLKLEVLKTIDFTAFLTFNQANTLDVDIWKIFAFYIGQNRALLGSGIEIYTKEDLVKHYPKLSNFIWRNPLTEEDKIYLTQFKNDWLTLIYYQGEFISEGQFLILNDERIDMINERF